MQDNDIMPFGYHKGKKMEDVPADYLIYAYEHFKLYGEVKQYIEDNMQFLQLEAINLKKGIK